MSIIIQALIVLFTLCNPVTPAQAQPCERAVTQIVHQRPRISTQQLREHKALKTRIELKTAQLRRSTSNFQPTNK